MKSRCLLVTMAALCGLFLLSAASSAHAQSHPDDTCWQSLAFPDSGGLHCLLDYNGVLVTGGFYYSGNYPVPHEYFAYPLSEWDGSTWSIVPDCGPWGCEIWGYVYDGVVFNGLPVIAGSFRASPHYGYEPTYEGLVGYDGETITPLLPVREAEDAAIQRVAIYNSQLIAAGFLGQDTTGFGVSGVIAYFLGGATLAAWDGGNWESLNFGSFLTTWAPRIWALGEYEGSLVVAGTFQIAGGIAASNIAAWNGSSWSALGEGIGGQDEYVYSLAVYRGKLYAGGQFTMAGGITVNNIACWDGLSWSALDSGVTKPSLPDRARVYALAVHDGQLIAAGEFTRAGDEDVNNIAAWNGATWLPLASGLDWRVEDMIVFNDTLVAGGKYSFATPPWHHPHIYRWKKAKTITIRDAHNDSLPNLQFDLIKVTNNRPHYDEDTLGSFVTDNLGRLAMTMVGDTAYLALLEDSSVVLRIGDMIKIARHVYSEPAVRHAGVLGTKYTIHIDNGEIVFDYNQYDMRFDTVAVGDQDVTLDHTEVRYNLLVSLEWDAAELYVDGLRKDFRQMSNYLYDVTDGQVRLDTIVMLDDAAEWVRADVRIRASNVHTPDAAVGALHHAGQYPINMPRKWFGNPDSSRFFSYLAHPLMDELSDNYRTLSHEFGHFALGFFDEYRCRDAFETTIACCMAPPAGNFGFMQFQYDREAIGGERASEMSNDQVYMSAGCRTTDQWRRNTMSCWEQFEFWMEDSIGAVFVPILKPHPTDSTERITGSLNYFPGPNNDLYNLDYDVGRLIHFASPVLPPAPNVRSVRIRVAGAPAGGADVTSLQTSTGWVIAQGRTTNSGWLWVLGVDVTQDTIEASGFGFAEVPPALATTNRNLSDRVWLTGSAAASDVDSLILDLRPVQGAFPAICDGRIIAGGWEYHLIVERMFAQDPGIRVSEEGGSVVEEAFNPLAGGYVSTLSDTLMSEGSATISAQDDAGEGFAFRTAYKGIDITGTEQLQHIVGPNGSAVVDLDTSSSGLTSILIVSSPYPVLKNGLAADAIQVGQSHSLSVTAGVDLQGFNALRLYYSESDLTPLSGYRVNESDLLVHHWNVPEEQWEPVGGLVDTSMNFVSASITETGVYSLFAVPVPTEVQDDDTHGSLPYRFDLSQNYPNPFNPITTIEYSIPMKSHVTIDIFNVLGQKVRTLVNEVQTAGSYRIEWNGSDESGDVVSTGVYIYRFQADDLVLTKKMLLIK